MKPMYTDLTDDELSKELKDYAEHRSGEIADLADADAYGDYQQGFNFGLMRAAQIIDKYKAKSEG